MRLFLIFSIICTLLWGGCKSLGVGERLSEGFEGKTWIVIISVIIGILIDRLFQKYKKSRQERQRKIIAKELKPGYIYWVSPAENPLNDISESGLWIPKYDLFLCESMIEKLRAYTERVAEGGKARKVNVLGRDVCWVPQNYPLFDGEVMTSYPGLLIDDEYFITEKEIAKTKKNFYVKMTTEKV